MARLTLLFATVLFAAIIANAQDDAASAPAMSINDLMVNIITPATNTLWGIENPESDADWQVFIDAADVVIEASHAMKLGGTGPNDKEWAADSAWQAYADTLLGAGRDARQAAIDKNIDAMYLAGEVLYPPCEECHMQFHPGVREQ
jgi:hypothetical protein